ncbi:sla2 Src-like adaptor 2 [Yamadazyma tenuis]|nr:sla2 Src-like adaptor 2 [Yamadazyma tenuis]
MSRAEIDLQTSVKKACNQEEVPPKRKHVRACIVYTWDHKNSRAFWHAIKIQPLQSDKVQLFKALVMIHKILQEGHPNSLKDGYRNREFISSLGSIFPSSESSYGRLINQYVKYILKKLDFHRNNPSFNGMFEYEEYISLRAVNDPNEGYDSILQLMELQDAIEDFQKLIFASINQTPDNLCKVSALVPLISEAYGIYKFCTSMLRAMYQQLGDDDALQALFEKFDSQHFVLRDFFTDCNSIKFLTTLVSIPRLPSSPPSLKVGDGETSILRPKSNGTESSTPQISSQPTSTFVPPQTPPASDSIFLQQTGVFDQQLAEQQRYQQELEAQRQQQLQDQLSQQQAFQQQQQEQHQRFLQEQQMLQQQQTQQQQSRVTELEHDLIMFKNQYDNDQSLLQQYDARVKSLENELVQLNENATQQVASKDEQIRSLEEQISNWSKKYESLAKLYSKLRQEHLDLLSRFKKIQQKISSAQESIQKREKFEKDLKAKNLELADLIRERDRARLDLDRLRGSKDQEIQKLQAELRELNVQVNESGKLQSMNLSTIVSSHQKELESLKSQLRDRDAKLSQLSPESLQEKLREKEIDLEIAQESLESALNELALSKNDQEDIVNAEIDQILLKNIEKFRSLIDLFLNNSIKRIQTTRHELDSSVQAGNLNASPEYVLSIIEACSDLASDFASVVNGFIVDGKSSYEDDSSYSAIILTSSELTTTLNDLMLNIKGVSRTVSQESEGEILGLFSDVLDDTEAYLHHITSKELEKFKNDDDRIDRVIDSNLQLQHSLQGLIAYVETLRSTKGINFTSKNLDKMVDDEMLQTAKTVQTASKFLADLMSNPKIKSENLEVHGAILSAAQAVIEAVSTLIKASTESQREIVSKGRGLQTRTEFYKKNNRWTEGLISASKAVAGATNILIQTADGVLRESNSHEQLIVASNEVAASTAQLVAASRVKANFVSQTQENLETASVLVSGACKSLVHKVQDLMETNDFYPDDLDLSKLTPYEGKTVEMEQQVEILKLENMLGAARKRLGDIRKHGYRDDVSDDER